MKKLNDFVIEKLRINKDINLNEETKDEQYRGNWEWFNNLVTNVKLTEQQYRAMFENIKDDELQIWIEEVKSAYAGIGGKAEREANQIGDHVDLARFYFRYPIEI